MQFLDFITRKPIILTKNVVLQLFLKSYSFIRQYLANLHET